jgi:hypothetical protein
LSLINVVFECFGANRLIYREENMRLFKILLKFFDDEKFMKEFIYFDSRLAARNVEDINLNFELKPLENIESINVFSNYDEKMNNNYIDISRGKSSKKLQIVSNSNSNNNINISNNLMVDNNSMNNNNNFTYLSLEAVYKMLIENIPLEKYYNLISTVNENLLKEKLHSTPNFYFENFCNLQKKTFNSYTDSTDNDLNNIDINSLFKRLASIQDNLPEDISVTEEACSAIFKMNKNNELVNPIDESLSFELRTYNSYVKRIKEDIEFIRKVLKGELLMNEDYNEMIHELCKETLPKKWKLHSFPVKNSNISHWLDNLKENFLILRKWLATASLDVYKLSMFYNPKLFLFTILLSFSRLLDKSPEKINLKLIITNEDKAYISSKDTIYVSGLNLKNGFYNNKMLINIENINECNLPVVGITYSLPDVVTEEQEEEIEYEETEEKEIHKTIWVPIYNREINDTFEKIEPLEFIEIKFDSSYSENFWISKGVKIVLES